MKSVIGFVELNVRFILKRFFVNVGLQKAIFYCRQVFRCDEAFFEPQTLHHLAVHYSEGERRWLR